MRKWLAIAFTVLCLALINYSIWQKEQQLAQGKVAFLKLAPVDPRSLMQGDYMVLRFDIANKIQQSLRASGSIEGHIIVDLDERQIAHFNALDEGQALNDNQLRMQFRIRHGRVMLATNAFFFQEGHGSAYDAAQYGEFRVSDSGELLLKDMYDAKLKLIKP